MSHRDKARSYSSSDSSGESAKFFRDESKEAIRAAEVELRAAEVELRAAEVELRRVKEEVRRRVKFEVQRGEAEVGIAKKQAVQMKRRVDRRKRRVKSLLHDAKRKRFDERSVLANENIFKIFSETEK